MWASGQKSIDPPIKESSIVEGMRCLVFLWLCTVLCYAKDSGSATCSSGSLSFVADLKNTSPWPHYWEGCVGSGHATLALRQDWRNQLRFAHDELGFIFVRFHGIFDDDMSTYLEGPNGEAIYSFFNADSIFDFLLSIGMKPLIELSFMPEDLASGNATIFHYKGNITPPKNYTQWYELVSNFASHLISRYGIDEVSSWFFETWNEPNCGFWTGTQEDYFHLLQVTSSAIKSVDKRLQVGGPATCQSQWLPETLAFCKQNNVTIDFVSTHEYPTDVTPYQRSIMKKVLTKSRQEVGNLPLFYTEYNDGLYWPPLHDTVFASAFAIFTIIDVQGLPDIFSWWTFSDIFEEQGFSSVPFQGGFGLQTIYGVPKPSFRAFQLLHETGNEQAKISSSQGNSTAGVLVTLDDDQVSILVYNYNIPNAPITNETLCISLKGLPSTWNGSAKIRRVDETHANPISLWKSTGEPGYLDNMQVKRLVEASMMVAEDFPHFVSNNLVTFEVTVPPLGIAAITFSL